MRQASDFRGVLQRTAGLALLCASLTTFANIAFAQQGTFVLTGSLNASRAQHTATLLNNGMVLIAGGVGTNANNNVVLASAELYDPTTGTFTPTGNLNISRQNHTATLLNNGMVLVSGGAGSVGVLSSAELYDPTNGTFTLTGSLNTARGLPTATLLNDGKVLIAGGNGNTGLASAELYDPLTGTFTATGSMSTDRYAHSATLLNNGTVLVTGGIVLSNSLALSSAELYNPTTGTFTPTGSMNTARFAHTATLLNNGMVLIACGQGIAVFLSSAELYNPTTGIFSPTGSMNTTRSEHTATLLSNGTVLVAGGVATNANVVLATAESYDPATGAFTPTGSMSTSRFDHSATLLNNGTVLIAAGANVLGVNTTFRASAELYELVALVPSSLSFSNQVIGTTSSSQTVALTNNQSTALSITTIAFSGTNASDFEETDNCVGSVAAGASCSINVNFTPAAAGSRAGSVNIANNLSANAVPVPLAGTGVTATQIVSLSASSMTFSNQIIKSTSPAQGITLTNTGNSSLTVSGLVFSGTNASEFAETDNCVGTIAAGAICTINVTFSPTATGTRTGTLSITDNATSPPSPQTVALTGTATAPSVSVTPSTIAFPPQYVGTSGLPQSVTVMNNGNAPLSITGVTTSATDFGTLNACGSTVAAGSSCAIGVFFDPTASGARPGTLTINDNAPGSPHTVALSGTGQDFSLAPVTPASATVSAGQMANYTVAVSPAGGFNQTVTLTCTGGPALSTCAVTPGSAPLNGTAATNVAVSVTTMAALPPLIIPFPKGDYRLPYLLTELLVLSLLIGLLSCRHRKRPRLAYGLALLGFLSVSGMMSACGGGSSGGNQGTPAGTYALVVSGTFTSGSTKLAHNANLTLVVQ
jgi:hypothetical protein